VWPHDGDAGALEPTLTRCSASRRRFDRASWPIDRALDAFSMTSFVVTYDVEASAKAEARQIVDALCLEQTVELPESLVPPGTWINEHVVGKCESLERCTIGDGTASRKEVFRALVRYADDTAGGELPQLLNVIFGNTSIKEKVMVRDVDLSHSMLSRFSGPRFGTKGLRKLLGVERGPIVMTALKPMGTPSDKLAEMAYAFAKGGIDIIKDDHGLANQRYAPYEERVRACAAAVKRANEETGRKCIYAPCINAPAHLVVQRAKFAKAAGAGAVLMIPGITGLDSMRALAEDPDFGLPIIAHPAILGAMLGGGTQNSIRGFSHGVLLGLLPRLAGADATIFPNFGGRFGFSVEECKDIMHGARRSLAHHPSILPSPGGGMTLDKVKKMLETYGQDVLLLVGGSLYSHSSDLTANARYILSISGRTDTHGPKEARNGFHTTTPYNNGYFTPGTGVRPKLKLVETPTPSAKASYPSHPVTPYNTYPAAPPSTPLTVGMDPEAVAQMSALKEKNSALESKVDELTALVKDLMDAEAKRYHGNGSKHASTGPLEGNHSKVLNRKKGEFQWERVPQEMYKMDGASFKECSRIELIGKRGESPVFHVRYFEVAPGGWTTLEHHQHEHVVVVLRGEGEIQLGLESYVLGMGDVGYTAPGDTHQLRCKVGAKEPFGFICVVAADRDRPIEDEPSELLKMCKMAHILDENVRVALEAQSKHRADHKAAHGAVADGSACEWKPGMKKKAHEEEVSACEWKPKSKQSATPKPTPKRYFP